MGLEKERTTLAFGRKDGGAGAGDLAVLDGGHAGDADRADDAALVDERETALDRSCAGERERAQTFTTGGDEVLKRFRRTAKRGGRGGLAEGDFDAAVLGDVHALEEDEVAAGVHDGDDDGPLVGDGFGLIVLPRPHGKVGIEVIVLHLGFGRRGLAYQVGSIDFFEVRKSLLRSILDQLVVSQRQSLTRKYFWLIRKKVDQLLVLTSKPVVEDLPFAAQAMGPGDDNWAEIQMLIIEPGFDIDMHQLMIEIWKRMTDDPFVRFEKFS